MINAVLVDDERPALRELEFQLMKFQDISIAGIYTDPLAAIYEISELKPQVVFLDINMPQLQGIDAAARILDSSPSTDIVFVTAFDQYAIEAFEINALDYILKPINSERLEKTLKRMIKKQPVVQQDRDLKLQINCLGRFQVGFENQEAIKWRTEKNKELFAFLFHNQGRDISKDELLDKLWTEDHPDKAIRQLYNGIYYIRKALEEYGISKNLISIGSNYNLKLGKVFSDVVRFQDAEKGSSTKSIEELEELEALYAGEYLEGEYYSWADIRKERLLKLYVQCLVKLSKKLIVRKQWDKAENCLLKAYNKNPYEHSVTELLLKLYKEIEDKISAVRHYNTYSNLIRSELGIKPDEKLQQLYKSIK